MKPDYLKPDSNQLLVEALDEFRQLESADANYFRALRQLGMSERGHGPSVLAYDICYVLFGVPKTVFGSFIVNYWVFEATDMGPQLSDKTRRWYFNSPVYKGLGSIRGPIYYFISKIFGIAIRKRAQKLTKKWPMYNNLHLTQMPVAQLRQEYGIEPFI